MVCFLMMIYKHNSILHNVLSLAELFMCKQIADVSEYEVCLIFEHEKHPDDLLFLK